MGDVGGGASGGGRPGGRLLGGAAAPKPGSLWALLGEAGEATGRAAAPARLRVSLTCIEALWLTCWEPSGWGTGPQGPHAPQA